MHAPDIDVTGMPYVPGVARGHVRHGMADDSTGHIVLLDGPPPAALPRPPAGIIVVEGAPFSHSMIPLLGSGVPTIILPRDLATGLQTGREVMLDGTTGRITSVVRAGGTVPRVTATFPPPAAAPATADGTRIALRVSARDTVAVRCAVTNGATGIGLVRSEFLDPGDGRLPDAGFYRTAFRGLCEAAAGLPVTIRLIDVAADKRPAWLSSGDGAGGVLGPQGVRLYDRDPFRHLVHDQLEAIAALAAEHDLGVLLPYVADSTELDRWYRTLREYLPGDLPVGAMAETPAAALSVGEWLDTVGFVGLGCNDLMQCLFGADRDRPELGHYIDPYAPVLYRFLRDIASTCAGRLDRVQLCGVLPQLPGILPVLLGLGFRAFSVEAALLPWLRQCIAGTSIAAAGELAEGVCAACSSTALRKLLGAGVPDAPG